MPKELNLSEYMSRYRLPQNISHMDNYNDLEDTLAQNSAKNPWISYSDKKLIKLLVAKICERYPKLKIVPLVLSLLTETPISKVIKIYYKY